MRNKPCPCGSGQKFKKCCGTRTAQLEMAKSTMLKQAHWLVEADNKAVCGGSIEWEEPGERYFTEPIGWTLGIALATAAFLFIASLR